MRKVMLAAGAIGASVSVCCLDSEGYVFSVVFVVSLILLWFGLPPEVKR